MFCGISPIYRPESFGGDDVSNADVQVLQWLLIADSLLNIVSDNFNSIRNNINNHNTSRIILI